MTDMGGVVTGLHINMTLEETGSEFIWITPGAQDARRLWLTELDSGVNAGMQ